MKVTVKGDLPDGFRYFPDFLTEQEESDLLRVISTLNFREFSMQGVTARRRIAQFGWHYAFESFRISPTDPPPAEFAGIRSRLSELAGVAPEEFAEVLVTEYRAGAGIGWHRDAPPFGIVAGISLAGSCRMRFRKIGDEKKTTAVELAPRSMYLITGPARSEWQHTIPQVKELRYSITFRTLRRKRTGAEGEPR